MPTSVPKIALTTPATTLHGSTPASPLIKVALVPMQVRDKAILIGSGEHQLKHHTIREQNMGRILLALGLASFALLFGIARNLHQRAPVGREIIEKGIDADLLRIDQRIHRIDQDRLHPPAFGIVAQNVVNNRDDIG